VAYPPPFEALLVALEALPGVGRATAERLALHLVRHPSGPALQQALTRALSQTLLCASCGNLSAVSPCELCRDESRDAGLLLVVEGPRDVEAVERSGAFRGRYHVLHGALQPADGVEPKDLALERLWARVGTGDVREVILGTDPDAEGEATAYFLAERIVRGFPAVRVTRLARGLPAGSALVYLHRGVIADALEGRMELRPRSKG
jgi:recombination protein RecR